MYVLYLPTNKSFIYLNPTITEISEKIFLKKGLIEDKILLIFKGDAEDCLVAQWFTVSPFNCLFLDKFYLGELAGIQSPSEVKQLSKTEGGHLEVMIQVWPGNYKC